MSIRPTSDLIFLPRLRLHDDVGLPRALPLPKGRGVAVAAGEERRRRQQQQETNNGERRRKRPLRGLGPRRGQQQQREQQQRGLRAAAAGRDGRCRRQGRMLLQPQAQMGKIEAE